MMASRRPSTPIDSVEPASKITEKRPAAPSLRVETDSTHAAMTMGQSTDIPYSTLSPSEGNYGVGGMIGYPNSLSSIHSKSTFSSSNLQQPPPGFDGHLFDHQNETRRSTDPFHSQHSFDFPSQTSQTRQSTRSSLSELNEESEWLDNVTRADTTKGSGGTRQQSFSVYNKEYVFQTELASVLDWLTQLDGREKLTVFYNLLKLCNREQVFILSPLLEDIKKGHPMTTHPASHAIEQTSRHLSVQNEHKSNIDVPSRIVPPPTRRSRSDFPKEEPTTTTDLRHLSSPHETEPSDGSFFNSQTSVGPYNRMLSSHSSSDEQEFVSSYFPLKTRHSVPIFGKFSSTEPSDFSNTALLGYNMDLLQWNQDYSSLYSYEDKKKFFKSSADLSVRQHRMRPLFHGPPADLESQPRRRSSTKDRGKIPEHVDLELVKNIPAWLHSLRLHKYTALFENLPWTKVIKLTDEDLQQMGMTALGARRKILKAFDLIKSELHLISSVSRF
jgi:hypothetical protein